MKLFQLFESLTPNDIQDKLKRDLAIVRNDGEALQYITKPRNPEVELAAVHKMEDHCNLSINQGDPWLNLKQ